MVMPMAKKKPQQLPEPLTPEKVIDGRLRRLADKDAVITFFTKLASVVIVVWLVFSFIFGLHVAANEDMYPRISAGDLLLYYRLDKDCAASDVIVFQKNGVTYTGRVVAIAGDSVEITKDGHVKINGSVQSEDKIFYQTPQYGSYVKYPLKLGAGQVFVLCDYREGAKDSRYFGAVNTSEIKGKVFTDLRRNNF